MPKEKSTEWIHVTVINEKEKNSALAKLKCIYCDKVYSGGIIRIRGHLAGDDINIKSCEKVPTDIKNMIKEDNTERANQDAMKRKREALDKATKHAATSEAHTSSSKQMCLTDMMKSGSKQLADAAIARLFFANGIPFVVAESKYFKEAIEAVSKCGPSYRAPNRTTISEKLLAAEVSRVEQKLSDYKLHMSSLGGTLVSDGWSNIQNRPMINCLIVTGDGTMFLDAIDTSGQTKDSNFIARELTRNIEAVGVQNIVQVVTDSAANCVAARKKISEAFPSVVCSPCVAHCLDLLLEDVGKLPWAASIIADGHSVVKFITTHQASLAFFRAHSTLELLKPGETRFASYFIMLQRLHETKDALQETVMDRDYKKWMSGPKYAEKGTSVTESILNNRFWDLLLQLTSICAPFVSVLRLVDGAVPCVGKIYWKMFQADQDIDSSTLDTGKKTQVRMLVATRWKMLHTDLHSAGFVLDPEYRAFLQHENEEVISGFHAMIERVHNGDVQSQVKAIQQHSVYRAGQGLFAREVATAAAKEMPAFRWWLAFGAHVPELQKVAIRVLSQVASASACERNWSTFEFIHTKKRNRLSCAKVRNVVFVHSNLRLTDKLTDINPIEETVEWSSEDED